MKFKLLESYYDGWHDIKYISEGEANKLLKGPYSQAFKANPIYRGIEKDPNRYFIVTPDPNELRQSAYAKLNYYTMVINNSKAWAEFPKRQIICTTGKHKASEYGDLFRVFPKNGAKIGICPHEDIWRSQFNELNGIVGLIFNEVVRYGAENYANSSWEKFIATCEKIDKIKNNPKKRKYLEFFGDNAGRQFDIAVYLDTKLTFLEFLTKYVYRPHGFSSIPIKNFTKSISNKEVWTDAPCLMYPARML